VRIEPYGKDSRLAILGDGTRFAGQPRRVRAPEGPARRANVISPRVHLYYGKLERLRPASREFGSCRVYDPAGKIHDDRCLGNRAFCRDYRKPDLRLELLDRCRELGRPPAKFELDGTFAAGSRGTTRLPGQEPLRWLIAEVTPPSAAMIEMSFGRRFLVVSMAILKDSPMDEPGSHSELPCKVRRLNFTFRK